MIRLNPFILEEFKYIYCTRLFGLEFDIPQLSKIHKVKDENLFYRSSCYVSTLQLMACGSLPYSKNAT
jgi:hypothetical protein